MIHVTGIARPLTPRDLAGRCIHLPSITGTTMTSGLIGTTTKRALVVGIDAYDDPWQLNGCVNDARAMAEILSEKFDFSHDDITLLTDAEATKDAILDAFDDLIDATTDGDVVVFYFAGHGSQLAAMKKTAKASGYSTALCPVDVTHPGPDLYYILDDEIHERLLDLAGRTSHITVIVDACHSGTVTRDLFGDRVRGMPANDTPASAVTIHTKPRRIASRPRPSSETGPSGWLSLSDNYVLIAGCRDEEVANEFTPPDSEEKHGALTYFLAKELTESRSGMSYRDVFERAAASVTARKPQQHPQMEGRVDRAVFGVTDLLPMDFAKVLSRADDSVRLNRGSAHGMTVGSVYRVYPQGTKRLPVGRDSPSTLGTIEIISVGAVQSVGRVTGELAPGEVVADTRAFEISHARGTLTMSVEIVSSTRPADADVVALRDELLRSPILEVAPDGRIGAAFARAYLIAPRDSAGPSDPAPQLGAIRAPTWAVVGTSGQLLMTPARIGDEALIRKKLEAVARYTQALELENPNPRSALRGKFSLEVMRRDTSGAWHVARPEMAGGSPVFEDGDAFAFRVTSEHDAPVYISVLDFQVNHVLDPLFPPAGAMEKLAARSTFEQGTVAPGARDGWVMQGSFADGGSEEQETIKLFVTSTPADFSVLKQEGTRSVPMSDAERSPLTALFRMTVGTGAGPAAAQPGTRAIVRASLSENDPDDWTTVTASFTVRRKTPTLALSAEPQAVVASGATVRATGVVGDVVVHAGGSGRAPSSETLDALADALEDTGGRIERTLELGNARVVEGTRGAASPSIELSVPNNPGEARMLVSTDADGVVTFHFPDDDGTRSIPGSRASGDAPLTFRIPLSLASSSPGEAGTRSALAAISSFATSAVGSQVLTLVVYPALGGMLGAAGEDMMQRWESWRRPYRARDMTLDTYASEKGRALDGDGWKRLAAGRALLLLHDGFDRSHGGFGAMPREFMAELHRMYDGRVFAFDHFTLSHDPRRNAKMLIDSMMLAPDTSLEVDILAHGRGGLVARSLVEGGSETLPGVDRIGVRNVIFVGTPNAGTPFADVKNLEKTLNRYTILASTMMTQFGGPIAGALFAAAKAAVFKVAAELKGLSAMQPASNFLESLKIASAAARPGRAPRYYALASDFEPQEPGLVNRLRNVMADKTIAGANDLVVSARSVLDTTAKYPIVESLVFSPSDGVAHSSYFASAVARARILKWLQAD